MENIHQFTFNDISEKPINFADYKGKVLLLVNTASKCGFTPQYKGLEKLYQTYKNDGLEIIAFPSNQFAGQEPMENEDIAEFCQRNYGVSFRVMEKSNVKGANANPIFQFLTDKKRNGKVSSAPKWNFQKYVVDKNGNVRDYFYSITEPESKKIIKLVEKLLAE